MRIEDIEVREDLTPEEFRKEYFLPERPVVLKNFSFDWAARSKWSLDFFKENYGENQVKVYDSSFVKPGKKYMSSSAIIPFGDYIEQLQRGSTKLRMFLYNIISHCPELKDDVSLKNYSSKFSKRFLFMFFGAKDSVTQLHYDIDLSHVFHTIFEGTKTFYLFSPKDSASVYKHPFTIRSYVDVESPDYEAFPGLKNANCLKISIGPGDTLFIPSGYWHHIRYHESGFALSLRAPHERITKRIQGFYNILVLSMTDRLMNRIAFRPWFKFKSFIARNRAERPKV